MHTAFCRGPRLLSQHSATCTSSSRRSDALFWPHLTLHSCAQIHLQMIKNNKPIFFFFYKQEDNAPYQFWFGLLVIQVLFCFYFHDTFHNLKNYKELWELEVLGAYLHWPLSPSVLHCRVINMACHLLSAHPEAGREGSFSEAICRRQSQLLHHTALYWCCWVINHPLETHYSLLTGTSPHGPLSIFIQRPC